MLFQLEHHLICQTCSLMGSMGIPEDFFTVYFLSAQNLSIIVGDHEGNVFGCLPHCTQWRLRLNDMIKTTNQVHVGVIIV